MALNLIKLCVGAESADDLKAYIDARWEREGQTYHLTRMFPKRKDELLAGGSLYWIIKGQITCRQKIIAIETVKATNRQLDENGEDYCKINLARELIFTQRRAKRPFQGWRYLKNGDAPHDAIGNSGEPSAKMLSELGLI